MLVTLDLSQFSVEVRKLIAKETEDPEIVDKLMDDCIEVRRVLAEVTKDPEVIDRLADDRDYQLRKFIVKNSQTSDKTLDKLEKDKRRGITERIKRIRAIRSNLQLK